MLPEMGGGIRGEAERVGARAARGVENEAEVEKVMAEGEKVMAEKERQWEEELRRELEVQRAEMRRCIASDAARLGERAVN